MSARGINKVILVGRLGNDPEVRYIPNGGAVANLQVATSESWRDKQTGEMREQTEWHRVVLFGKLAEVAGEYLRKGARIIAGAVVLKGRYLKIFTYGVQLIIAQANIQRLRQRQRIDISVPELNAIALAYGFDKADIEAVRIVRH